MANPVKVNIVDETTIHVIYDDGIEGDYSLQKNGETTKKLVKIDEDSGDIIVNKLVICKNSLYKQLYMRNMMQRLKIDLDKL
ncbi:MAG: hypothetical protein ACEPO8_14745 [Rhodothermaceae bacterium]